MANESASTAETPAQEAEAASAYPYYTDQHTEYFEYKNVSITSTGTSILASQADGSSTCQDCRGPIGCCEGRGGLRRSSKGKGILFKPLSLLISQSCEYISPTRESIAFFFAVWYSLF